MNCTGFLSRTAVVLAVGGLWPTHAAAKPPEFLSIRQAPAAAPVPCFEKFELEIDLRATFENPYDPDQLDLRAAFVSPSGKTFRVCGFFAAGDGPPWFVRFAPTEPGQWTWRLTVRDRKGSTESDLGKFQCVASDHPGFVTIAPNRRYFQHANGRSFYGVGLWYNDEFSRRRGAITENSLDDLRRVGVNFISFFPTPLETLRTGLGRYDANRAARLDQLLDWCEDRGLHVSWNLLFHSHISEAVWGGWNSRYHENPYRTVAPAKDFFASDEVWKYQQKLYRYIIARWGYSRAIFLWFIIDEINGTEGWVEGDRDAAHEWCRRVNHFFHENDPYHRATTGTQSGGIDQWWPEGYEIFDVAAREIYEAQGHPMPSSGKPDLINDHPLRASYRNYAGQTRDLWHGFEKPALIGECGYDHTYYEPGTPGYLASYHNALWASLASGAAATPFWWAHSPYITPGLMTRHVRAFADFVHKIDFARGNWAPLDVEITAGDGWAMQRDGFLFGWVVNPSAGIANETFTIDGLDDGMYDVRLYHTWRGEYLPAVQLEATGGRLSVTLPELRTQDGHANHLGDDVAFTVVKASAEGLQPPAGE